jgi:hypothetical protein
MRIDRAVRVQIMGTWSAAEVAAAKERRLREDPVYRAEFERQEAERAERSRQSRVAEQPVLADLRAMGLDLGIIWTSTSSPNGVPVPSQFCSSILLWITPTESFRGSGWGLTTGLPGHGGATFASCSSTPRRTLFVTCWPPHSAAVRRGSTSTTSSCSYTTRRSDSAASIFMRPINRIGNRIISGQGRAVVEGVADDPVLGKEATAILKGRGRND